jgi:biotin synthase
MKSEVLDLLQEDGHVLFKRAQQIARKMDSFFRFPLFFNTTCRMKPICPHCSWYSGARYDSDWWRKYSKEEVINKAIQFEKVGIKRTMTPSGWMGFRVPDYFCDYIAAVKQATSLKLYGFYGPIDRESLINLKEAGMDGYWCGVEVMNEAIFKKVRPGDSLEAHLKTLRETKELGLNVWSSILLGVDESPEDIARGIEFLKNLGVDAVMILPLRPSPYTPMEQYDMPNLFWTSKVIAATRIALGEIDIITFLGYNNSEWAITAGANGFHSISKEEMNKIDTMRKKIYAMDRVSYPEPEEE